MNDCDYHTGLEGLPEPHYQWECWSSLFDTWAQFAHWNDYGELYKKTARFRRRKVEPERVCLDDEIARLLSTIARARDILVDSPRDLPSLTLAVSSAVQVLVEGVKDG